MFNTQFKYLFIIILITVFSGTLHSQFVYNWFPVPSGTVNNLNGVNGSFCVGSGGVILRTENNGLSWQMLNSGTSLNLNGVVSVSNTTLAAGNNGLILKDNGGSWVQLNTGTTNNLYSITRAGTNTFYAAGASGTVLLTTNSGTNWSVLLTPTAIDLKSISAIAMYGWAAGTSGTLIKTTNWGANWNIVSLGTSTNLNSVFFADVNTGWILGNSGLIMKSTNGGSNWTIQLSGTAADLKCGSFLSSDIGWICGSNGTVLKTTNGGALWSLEEIFTYSNLNSIYLIDQNRGYTVGNSGNIFVRRLDSLYMLYYSVAGNNISSWFINRGIFDQDVRTSNTPGFEWPINSGKFAVFSAGLTVAAKVNGSLRMAAASYMGEYYPGYVADSAGFKVGRTDSRFRFYKVSRGDNMYNNPSWLNWGIMVPYGVPFVDVNHSGYYEPAIDTPGVRGASQTIFICLTDGFTGTHRFEGFGGNTAPLYAELHMTAWCYDNPGYQDMQFIKWDIINKGSSTWNNTYISIYSDPDLGYPEDDYIGCDTTRNFAFCYNGDNDDGSGSGNSYGINPPAFGFKLLNCLINPALTMKSVNYTICGGCPGPPCEINYNTAEGSYFFMKGLKGDGTPWVIPNTDPPQITKFCYSGDPETNTGWTELGGKVWNCGGLLTGQLQIPVPPGDRRLLVNMGYESLTVNPGDTQKVQIAQLMARGTSNVNSVTKLKQLSDVAQRLCDSGFAIGVKQISNQVPRTFKLYQNYPNPFNPVTNIKYDIAYRTRVKIIIYDVNGREVKTLVDEIRNPGTYTADWDGSNFSSGVYFYKLETDKFADSKKMVLIK